MYPQTPLIITFFIILLLVLCNGSYIVEPLHHQTYSKYYYHVHDGRLIKTKHQHFGHITRINRDTLFSSKSQGKVNVDDFGAKGDGRDDREVTNNNKIPRNIHCHFFY
jgi:hypothetical protein